MITPGFAIFLIINFPNNIIKKTNTKEILIKNSRNYVLYLTPIGVKKITSPPIIKNIAAAIDKGGILTIRKYKPIIIEIKPII